MNTEVIESINGIRGDRVHGAGWLSRKAINTLSLAISKSQCDSIADFLDEVRAIAAELMNARPSMISIANYIDQFLNSIVRKSRSERELSSLKSFAQIESEKLIKLSSEASLKVAVYGSEIIKDMDVIITCSYSSTVCEVFKLANWKGAKFQVIAAESRFNGRAFGEITKEHLDQHQVSVEIIPDDDIDLHMSRAKVAVVGADSILTYGSLINGVPTYKLARAASETKVAFYTLCETAKFDVKGYMTEGATEPGFDETPFSLVTGIITERGIMEPSRVLAHIEKMRHIPP